MIPSAALAQQAQLPSSAQPGRPPLEPVLPQSSAPAGAVRAPQASQAEAPPEAKDYSFVLKSLQIDGATAFTPASLRPLYAGLYGKTVSVRDMYEVANKLELRYREAGFVTTRVVVPAQSVEDGRFRIQVIESTVAEIVYQGDIGPAAQAVKALLQPILKLKPVSIGAIERALLLANDQPGLTVRANLEPSKTAQGASVLVVTLARKAVDAAATIDNRATPYSGAYEAVPTVSFNAFGGRADTVSLAAKLSSPVTRDWYVSGNYSSLLTRNGLTFSFTSSYARSNPGLDLEPLDIQSHVVSETGSLTYPIIRSRRQNLRVSSEFEYRDVVTDLQDAPFNRDNLRILRASISYDRADAWNGITAARLTLHQGLDVLGASRPNDPLASRVGGRADATKLTFGLTRVQDLPARFSLFATATGQVANMPLLASEQIALGGGEFGRAFDQGEISGDKGWAASAELRYAPDLKRLFPYGLQLYSFIDGGQVWNASQASPIVGGHSLASAGGGLRFNLTSHVFAAVEAAQAFEHTVATQGGKPARVFFTVSARY